MTRTLLAAALVIVAACGGTTTTTGSGASTTGADGPAIETPSTTLEATTSASPSTTAPTGNDRAAVEEYFVAVTNILGEERNRSEACQEETSSQAPVFDAAPADETEAFLQAMLGCLVQPSDDATRLLDDIAVPPRIAAAHQDYLASRTAWVDVMSRLGAEVKTMLDAEELFVDPDVVAANVALGGACWALESAAAESGFTVSLVCPAPPEPTDATAIAATFEAARVAVSPAGAVDNGNGIELVITNTDTVPHQPVVATLFSGDPAQLPLLDDVVDLKQSGIVSVDGDDAAGRGYFGLVWPEVTGEEWDASVPELAPGASRRVTLRSGEHLVFDHRPGAYQSGAFAVMVVASMDDLRATYVAQPNAAETCDQLADVIAGLYTAYTDEVALLTAEAFAASPLSMMDDLRFGAALERSSRLGCDQQALDAMVTAAFCPATAAEGSAAASIIDRVCGGV